MPLPLIVGVAVRVAIAAAGKIIAKRATTAAARKAAEAAARKAAQEAAKKAAANGLGRRAGTAAARDAAKKAAEKSLKSSSQSGSKGPPNTAGKHKAKKVNQKPHTDCGKVDKYSKAPKKIGKRNADHTPSGAAMKLAAERELKRLGAFKKMTDKQVQSVLNSVYNNAQTITIPESVHKAGRTWGSKNKPLKAGDSRDLNGAFEEDTKAIQQAMDMSDEGCSEKYAAAVETLKKIDFEQYVKDAVSKHKTVLKVLGK